MYDQDPHASRMVHLYRGFVIERTGKGWKITNEDGRPWISRSDPAARYGNVPAGFTLEDVQATIDFVWSIKDAMTGRRNLASNRPPP